MPRAPIKVSHGYMIDFLTDYRLNDDGNDIQRHNHPS